MSVMDETVELTSWNGPWPHDDPDAAFKAEVAAFRHVAPLGTIDALARHLGIPRGAIVRYVLARWASAGSEAILAAGPEVIDRMAALCARAEAADSNEERLRVYQQLRGIVSWLSAGVREPVADPLER